MQKKSKVSNQEANFDKTSEKSNITKRLLPSPWSRNIGIQNNSAGMTSTFEPTLSNRILD